MHDELFRLAAVAGFRAQEGALMADPQPPVAAKPRSRTRLVLQVVGSLVLVG